MRKPLLILLGVELLLAIALGKSGHIDRSAMARAWMQWRQNPTTGAQREFKRQQGITEIQRWAFTGVVFALLAGGTVLAARI